MSDVWVFSETLEVPALVRGDDPEGWANKIISRGADLGVIYFFAELAEPGTTEKLERLTELAGFAELGTD